MNSKAHIVQADETHKKCPKCLRIKHLTHHGERELCKRCYEKDRQGDLALQLRVLYGITLDDFHAMLDQQSGLCALCGRPPRKREKRLRVDHDHTTGKVRGLLCNACNSALGLLQDSPDLLRKAADYIERQRS